MLQFKHPHNLKQLPESHPAYPLIKDLVERLIVDFPPGRSYEPNDDGWVVEHPHGPVAASPKALDTSPLPNPSAKPIRVITDLLRPDGGHLMVGLLADTNSKMEGSSASPSTVTPNIRELLHQ